MFAFTRFYLRVLSGLNEIVGSTPNFQAILGEMLIKFHRIASVKTGLAKIAYRIRDAG